eukprot:8026308-Pyramimonas_sp.AAC.1
MKVYLYREGFARFTAARYSTSKEDISNNFIHLTNHAIQKKDEDYDPTTTDLKWPIGQLKRVRCKMRFARCWPVRSKIRSTPPISPRL